MQEHADSGPAAGAGGMQVLDPDDGRPVRLPNAAQDGEFRHRAAGVSPKTAHRRLDCRRVIDIGPKDSEIVADTRVARAVLRTEPDAEPITDARGHLDRE